MGGAGGGGGGAPWPGDDRAAHVPARASGAHPRVAARGGGGRGARVHGRRGSRRQCRSARCRGVLDLCPRGHPAPHPRRPDDLVAGEAPAGRVARGAAAGCGRRLDHRRLLRRRMGARRRGPALDRPVPGPGRRIAAARRHASSAPRRPRARRARTLGRRRRPAGNRTARRHPRHARRQRAGRRGKVVPRPAARQRTGAAARLCDVGAGARPDAARFGHLAASRLNLVPGAARCAVRHAAADLLVRSRAAVPHVHRARRAPRRGHGVPRGGPRDRHRRRAAVGAPARLEDHGDPARMRVLRGAAGRDHRGAVHPLPTRRADRGPGSGGTPRIVRATNHRGAPPWARADRRRDGTVDPAGPCGGGAARSAARPAADDPPAARRRRSAVRPDRDAAVRVCVGSDAAGGGVDRQGGLAGGGDGLPAHGAGHERDDLRHHGEAARKACRRGVRCGRRRADNRRRLCRQRRPPRIGFGPQPRARHGAPRVALLGGGPRARCVDGGVAAAAGAEGISRADHLVVAASTPS